jgi:hypothetical protein
MYLFKYDQPSGVIDCEENNYWINHCLHLRFPICLLFDEPRLF